MSLDDKVHWAVTHSIIMGMKASNEDDASKIPVVHAPFTMNSFKYPRAQFEKAVYLAQLFNILVEQISRDPKWLIETLEPTAVTDVFIRRLICVYKEVLQDGIKQTLTLAINRSDYMLHEKEGDSRSLLQVELNTIASSFGALSTRISEMHRELGAMGLINFSDNEIMDDKDINIPINNALNEIANGLAIGHKAFLSLTGLTDEECSVAMIVQPNERNFSDQRLVQYQLWKVYKVRCFRVTLLEVHQQGKIGDKNNLMMGDKTVSVVYFRAGYTPEDHPSEKEWDARLLIEKSFAIKCPTIAYHLAGSKKVQQVLADPGVLERFIVSHEERTLLRSVFAGLYSLSEPTLSSVQREQELILLNEIKKKIINENGDGYVMKPQREGGGNNMYGSDVADALKTMPLEEQAAYIIMERILPPSSSADLVRDANVYTV